MKDTRVKGHDLSKHEKLKRKLNIISFAKSMVSPRHDADHAQIRIEPELETVLNSQEI